MKYSKKQLIERTLQNPDVIKCIEAIVRTYPRSDQRDVVVDAFEFKFCQVATELFKENVGCENFGENVNLKARITFSGRQELLNTSGMNNKILTILCKPENLKFDIGPDDDTYIIIKEFEVEEKETSLSLSVYFTGDDEIDDFIIKIINSLRKR